MAGGVSTKDAVYVSSRKTDTPEPMPLLDGVMDLLRALVLGPKIVATSSVDDLLKRYGPMITTSLADIRYALDVTQKSRSPEKDYNSNKNKWRESEHRTPNTEHPTPKGRRCL
jgi:hypothetical protein